MALSVILGSTGGSEGRDFSGEGVRTHIRADRLIIPFSWVSYYKRKYKQDPRGSKDKMSVSDDS